jgi:hypothetical protein
VAVTGEQSLKPEAMDFSFKMGFFFLGGGGGG